METRRPPLPHAVTSRYDMEVWKSAEEKITIPRRSLFFLCAVPPFPPHIIIIFLETILLFSSSLISLFGNRSHTESSVGKVMNRRQTQSPLLHKTIIYDHFLCCQILILIPWLMRRISGAQPVKRLHLLLTFSFPCKPNLYCVLMHFPSKWEERCEAEELFSLLETCLSLQTNCLPINQSRDAEYFAPSHLLIPVPNVETTTTRKNSFSATYTAT